MVERLKYLLGLTSQELEASVRFLLLPLISCIAKVPSCAPALTGFHTCLRCLCQGRVQNPSRPARRSMHGAGGWRHSRRRAAAATPQRMRCVHSLMDS